MLKKPATVTQNCIGLTKQEYQGGKSTMCPGCGHNSISNHIILACYELGIDPRKLAKFSGIGCSSKTPAYFISHSHAFNSAHGRMPSIATGAMLANRQLIGLGISGDGDTSNIGIGQFIHMTRRNLPLVYIIENNGVYGLTKGQFSATADEGSRLKSGEVNKLESIDLCTLAIELGCSFVARSFSGDKKQLIPLLKAAFAHAGTAVLDVISPCVTFNDHPGSTRSYDYMKEHDFPLHQLDFVPYFEEIEIDYEEGEAMDVQLHDGSHLTLKKVGKDYNPRSRIQALQVLAEAHQKSEHVTGLLYINPEKPTFIDTLDMVEQPLASLGSNDLRPSPEDFATLMQSFK